MYDYLNDNPPLFSRPVDYVTTIRGSLRKMRIFVLRAFCLTVDLTGACNS